MLVLKPSAVHGIGVFTTAPVSAGAHVRLWEGDDWRSLTFAEAEADPDAWAVRDIYCVSTPTGYICPLDFHRMSIGWYMNHSARPNVRSSEELGWEYYAVQDIAAGEELFCDYRELSPVESAPPGTADS